MNWAEIKNLHVINKLEEIVGRYFGVDLFFADEFGKIEKGFFEKNRQYSSAFLKLQMDLGQGHEYLGQDAEGAADTFVGSDLSSFQYTSFFKGLKGVVAKVTIEGQFTGHIFAYPFFSSDITEKEREHLIHEIVALGGNEKEFRRVLENIVPLSVRDEDFLRGLVELVAQEVVTYHEEIQKREERILELNSELGTKYRYHSMIGKSKEMQAIYRLLEKISKSESTVLIQGSNGTGKELVAKAIHYNSPRKDRVFLAQNCSAFNDNLLDSELFGHVRGAFTGAIRDKKGLFEMANGGTLFLDEIGDTSQSMQVKLLRVLQEGTFLPVGATSPRKVNVRILAATNKDLREMMSKGEFREDLYYRINVINIVLPNLKDRREDIPLLTEHFLNKRCAESGVPLKIISQKGMELIFDYSWPGNVRELENEIERLVVLAGEEKNITPDILSPKILDFNNSEGPGGFRRKSGNLKEAMEELERGMIKEGLKRCNFNKSRLAKELGISRAGLIMKVEKYGLDKRKKPLKVA